MGVTFTEDWDELLQTEMELAAPSEMFVHVGHINLRSFHFAGLEMPRDFQLGSSDAMSEVVHVTLPGDERGATGSTAC